MRSIEAGFAAPQELGLGDEFVLRLPENPTTGFRWQVSWTGDAALEIVDDQFEPGSAGSLPGAAGRRILRYVARKTGTLQLVAVHQRSWDAASKTDQKQQTIVIR